MTKSHPWLTHPSVALVVSHPRKVNTVNTFTKSGKCWKFFANLEEERLPERCWLPHFPGPFCRTTPRRECWYCNRWLKSSVQGTWAGRPHWWCSDRSLKKNLMLKAWTYFVYWVTCQRWRAHRGPSRWSYWRELELRRGSKRVAPNKRRRGSFKHYTSQYSLAWYVSGMAIRTLKFGILASGAYSAVHIFSIGATPKAECQITRNLEVMADRQEDRF